MFGFFKQKRFLGIDYGTFSIKVVELEIQKTKVHLINFGVAVVRENVSKQALDSTSQDARCFQYLSALLQRMHPGVKDAYVSLPSSSGLTAMLSFPATMKKNELDEAVRFEARKYIPVESENVVVSWDKISSSPGMASEGQTTQEILLVAALKGDVEKRGTIMQKAGISIRAMELETFSLARSLAYGNAGMDIIVDIGFCVSNLLLINRGNICFTRTVDTGGGDITKTIMDGMGISFDRAEMIKKEQDFFHTKEIPLHFLGVESIIHEVQQIIDGIKQRDPGATIDHIILSGGSALLPGLASYIQECLGIPAGVGDPWRQIHQIDKKFSDADKQKIGGSLSVALGLALRGKEEK